MTNEFHPAFARQYDSHLKRLKLKWLQLKTIDVYICAIRRLGGYFDCHIDALSEEQLTEYFSYLIGTHSWSAASGSSASCSLPLGESKEERSGHVEVLLHDSGRHFVMPVRDK